MKVTFTKTHPRRYRITVEGEGLETRIMDPAPGFDERLPHDAAHFIVERELGIRGGIFGQLAMGGSAMTFQNRGDSRLQRKGRHRGARIAKEHKSDALFSEHAVYATQSRWENHEYLPPTDIPPNDIKRVIKGFESFARSWSSLPVGGSLTLEWAQRSTAGRK
jgi:hypothetical protein